MSEVISREECPSFSWTTLMSVRPGFQVVSDDTGDLPGWVFIAPDPGAKARTGFAGGDLGYLAVMRWAGWGVITERLPGGLYAACHPDHRYNPFPTATTS
ncbi:hypothetical protein [Streptomyces sp. NEAU-S77]|uniref:hypothetical protein n=1 Tax=Streptomyces sp. NEAU-S77 TaxID=3411033 RepID=UPI003BA1F8B0